MQKNAWMIAYFFNQRFGFFCKSILKGNSQQNYHLLIMDGHGSHVIIKRLEQAIEFGIYMVTSPSHISHMFQLLDVTCFKPFKIALRKERDVTMAKNVFIKPNKITLAKWVDKVLQQSLKKQNMKFGFKFCKIWPLNSIAMAEKFGPSEISLQQKERDLGNSYHSNTTMQTSDNENEAETTTYLLNIVENFQGIVIVTHTIDRWFFSPTPRYYLEMPCNPTTPTTNHELVVNIIFFVLNQMI